MSCLFCDSDHETLDNTGLLFMRYDKYPVGAFGVLSQVNNNIEVWNGKQDLDRSRRLSLAPSGCR